MTTLVAAAVTLAVLVGGLSFGFAGFAFVLFASSALTLTRPPQIVIPAVMLIADTMALPLLWEHRRHLRGEVLRGVPPFAPWSIAFLGLGVAAGALLLARATPDAGRAALAVIIGVFVVAQLRRRRRPSAERAVPASAAGTRLAAATGGLLDGWLGTGGTAMAMYFTWRRLAPGVFVVALLVYFLVTDTLRFVTYSVFGYWSRESLRLHVEILPLAALGYAGGVLLRQRFASVVLFRTVVLVLLGVYAAALAGRVVLDR